MRKLITLFTLFTLLFALVYNANANTIVSTYFGHFVGNGGAFSDATGNYTGLTNLPISGSAVVTNDDGSLVINGGGFSVTNIFNTFYVTNLVLFGNITNLTATPNQVAWWDNNQTLVSTNILSASSINGVDLTNAAWGGFTNLINTTNLSFLFGGISWPGNFIGLSNSVMVFASGSGQFGFGSATGKTDGNLYASDYFGNAFIGSGNSLTNLQTTNIAAQGANDGQVLTYSSSALQKGWYPSNSSGGSSGAFIANLNGFGTNLAETNGIHYGNFTNTLTFTTNNGASNTYVWLQYTNTITNNPSIVGITMSDNGAFDWEHFGNWGLNMSGFLNFAVAGSIQMTAETGTLTMGGVGVTISTGTTTPMRFDGGGVNDMLSLNFPTGFNVDTIPLIFGGQYNNGATNATYQIFSLGGFFQSAGTSNYIATVSQTNSIATSSSFLVYTNRNFYSITGVATLNFGIGTNAHEIYYYTMSGQSLDGTIEYETDTPGLLYLTVNGTTWTVLSNRPPLFVGVGTPTGITAYASQTGVSIYSTAASTVSHKNIFTASIKLMTR